MTLLSSRTSWPSAWEPLRPTAAGRGPRAGTAVRQAVQGGEAAKARSAALPARVLVVVTPTDVRLLAFDSHARIGPEVTRWRPGDFTARMYHDPGQVDLAIDPRAGKWVRLHARRGLFARAGAQTVRAVVELPTAPTETAMSTVTSPTPPAWDRGGLGLSARAPVGQRGCWTHEGDGTARPAAVG